MIERYIEGKGFIFLKLVNPGIYALTIGNRVPII